MELGFDLGACCCTFPSYGLKGEDGQLWAWALGVGGWGGDGRLSEARLTQAVHPAGPAEGARQARCPSGENRQLCEGAALGRPEGLFHPEPGPPRSCRTPDHTPVRVPPQSLPSGCPDSAALASSSSSPLTSIHAFQPLTGVKHSNVAFSTSDPEHFRVLRPRPSLVAGCAPRKGTPARAVPLPAPACKHPSAFILGVVAYSSSLIPEETLHPASRCLASFILCWVCPCCPVNESFTLVHG